MSALPGREAHESPNQRHSPNPWGATEKEENRQPRQLSGHPWFATTSLIQPRSVCRHKAHTANEICFSRKRQLQELNTSTREADNAKKLMRLIRVTAAGDR